MKFSFSWLNSYFKNALDIQQLEQDLTMAGLEVESVQHLAENLEHIVVGEIVAIEKHPDADKLNVCQVNVGAENLQIVCGAPNARSGIKVPCALIGAKFPEFTIKKAKLRGVESHGMLCSAKELNLSDAAEGLLELDGKLTNGMGIVEALHLDDAIIEVSLTPNRADCLSVHGIAREVKAITGKTLCRPSMLKSQLQHKDFMSFKSMLKIIRLAQPIVVLKLPTSIIPSHCLLKSFIA